MAVNWPGVGAVLGFYTLVLVIGLVAARKTSKAKGRDGVILADRQMGVCLAFFTLTATMIGGGFINGTAESFAFDGMLWTQAPFLYCISLTIGGLVYAPRMRRGGYVTMFDTFQLKYGRRLGGLLFLPQLCSDVLWGASVLAALGNTIAVILDVDASLSILVSSAVAVLYTMLGGLWSVAYTDVIQFFCIAGGLYLVFPFALQHPAVDLSRVSDRWLGTVQPSQIGLYIDTCCLLIMGGLPWQVFYQRVLACRDYRVARTSTLMSAAASLMLSVPPTIIGLTGAAADWNQTDYVPGTADGRLSKSDRSAVLPLVVQYLVPTPVSVIAIGTVAAAVMSSADSCILASASVFAKNVYCDCFRPQASQREMMWVLRGSIVVCGTLATVIAVTASSIYGLFVLCSDLMYVVLFPQLTLVLWFAPGNGYGCLSGLVVSLLLRLLAGEPMLFLPPLLRYPLYDPDLGQLFPVRTFAMLLNFIVTIAVSLATRHAFTAGWLSPRYDVLHCLRNRTCNMRDDKPANIDDVTANDVLKSDPDCPPEVTELEEKAPLATPEADKF